MLAAETLSVSIVSGHFLSSQKRINFLMETNLAGEQFASEVKPRCYRHCSHSSPPVIIIIIIIIIITIITFII